MAGGLWVDFPVAPPVGLGAKPQIRPAGVNDGGGELSPHESPITAL